MVLFIINLLFVLLRFCNAEDSDPNYCTDDFLFKNIPGGIAKQLFLIATTGNIKKIFGCGQVKVEENLIKFLLYNRQNLNNPILINSSNLNELDPSKPIIFQLHGWLCNFSNNRMPEMKNAYLSRYDANVIILDWSRYSIDLYTESFCYIPPIAKITGKLICDIDETLNVDISKIHIVGHSMGAQLSGIIGQEVQKQCNKTIGRITGLDPAGLLYQNLPIDRRLDDTDALFVDVIHSNMGFFGYFDSCGSIDFYPNCGVQQPSCPIWTNINTFEKLLNLPFGYNLCNHVRSLDYMIESIRNTNSKFIGKNCDFIPALPIIGLCGNIAITGDIAEMGENSAPGPPGRKFCLTTNSQPPFAQD